MPWIPSDTGTASVAAITNDEATSTAAPASAPTAGRLSAR